jgi:hypothetical protein
MFTSKIYDRPNVEEWFENVPTFGFITVIEDDENECGFEMRRRLRRNNEEGGLGVLAIFSSKPLVESVD